ncbi:MAG: electron transfer flavoprotein beta subunit/FixA family protein [Anaerolineales bacterium]|nr:electron transfer flavoprotein beta subunit/FixA family protein [Anaerolineales bacterium]
MAYNSVVLVKQVPNTSNITGQTMKEDGTINRAALPAIFNPEDLNALEMALSVKDEHGGKVTVLTMGPLRAADILRESLYRGADRVILLSDKKFAGSDTLATSYALKCAVEKIGDYDLIFCGRQAIDGDTAQVGPQVAEKLSLPQITYAESILSLEGKDIVVERAFLNGKETVKCTLPCLLTVVGSANLPRPPSANRLLAFKLAAIPQEIPALLKKWPEFKTEEELESYLSERGLNITVWDGSDIDIDYDMVGLNASPTKVSKVDYIILETGESMDIEATQEGIAALVNELVSDYTI